MRVLVTGSAGFIGFHVCRALLAAGHEVLGLDSFSPYYNPALKQARSALLRAEPGFAETVLAVEDMEALSRAWTGFAPDVVIHLAAQAGVRHSLESPASYITANLVGTANVLEMARHAPVRHLLAASTSSVYGANGQMPFDEGQKTVHPLSLYAATKAGTELMGHSYSHLFAVPATFFRFFTVYGPWGRPDMAPSKFARAILAGQPIDLYNGGVMVRDFTFVDDLVRAVLALVPLAPGATPVVAGDTLSPVAPFRVVNIGAGQPVELETFIAALERALGRPALRNLMPMQPGDVPATEASIELLHRLTGPLPVTSVEAGVAAFAAWCRERPDLLSP